MRAAYASAARSTRAGVPALAAVAGVIALAGCRKDQGKAAAPVHLEGDNLVLASIDSKPITKYDLDQTLAAMLGEGGRNAPQGDKVRRVVLDSLIETGALALAAEKELTPEERAVVDRQVAGYREQLLAKRYLNRHTPPAPVTDKMVEDYYSAHPEQFGGKTRRTYELIGTEGPIGGDLRDRLIDKLVDPGKQKDWAAWSEKLKHAGFAVVYRGGEVDPNDKLLNPRLVELMSSLHAGQASQVAFVQGRAYVVRVTSEQRTPPRPIDEVRGDIRASLVPTQVRDAVKRASDEVLKTVKVVYQEPKTPNP